MTVLEVIQRSADFLTKKGVDSPRLHAELLLAHLLQLPRMQLYLDFQRELTPLEVESMRELVRRRGLREPVQQLTGSTSFCGLEITVTREVLVPRPETELLAECAWVFLKTPPQTSPPAPSALDFGTGSGCLAIALATHCPGAHVRAIDISPAALDVARQNAVRHGLEDRIQFFPGDGFAALPEAEEFDLIVSNPPYIPSGEIRSLQPEVRDFEPRQALDGGSDGLDYYRRLAAEAAPWLRSGGRLMVEFGVGQADSLREVFSAQKWVVEAVKEDYNRCPRILVAYRN
jgi:release factor glutamine methyltransferase